MKRMSNGFLSLAVIAGVGLGIGCGYFLFNEELRARLGRKARRLGRACRNQTEELRETAGELLEKGERTWKDARDTAGRVYHKVAG